MHHFLALLVLLTLSSVAHAQHAVQTPQAEMSQEMAIAPAHCNVLYWPNKNLGFGHIALEFFFATNTSDVPDIYLSWASGNDKDFDQSRYVIKPKIVRLDTIPLQDATQFALWFYKSDFARTYLAAYGQQYALLRNNCAHAVLQGLNALGYGIHIKGSRKVLRPSQVYRAAKKIKKKLERESLTV